jgi:hypothetical protein
LAKYETLPRYCLDCDVRFACNGECPKNRFRDTPDGEPGLNYPCAGYKAFFTHIDGVMRLMADRLRVGGYADEVMTVLSSAGRNEPCPLAAAASKPSGATRPRSHRGHLHFDRLILVRGNRRPGGNELGELQRR